MIRRKRVMERYADEPAVEVATFAFDGVRLLASYLDDATRQLFAEGIAGPDRLLTPDDGSVFFDGLDAAFARSSTLHVVAD